MKKVFSITILLFLLVAASFAGATYWFGVEAEQQYRETLEQASQSIYIHAANESYDRGFLRSKAHTAVKIRDLSRGSEQQEEFLGFTLIHDIRHGPLPVGGLPDGKMQLKPVLAIIDTRIELDPDTQGRLKKTFDVLPEIASMENCTTLSIGGNGETRLVIPPLRQTLGKDKKVSLDWKGLTASMTFTADFKGYTGTLSAPGLEIVGDDGILEIQGLASTFDTHEGVSGLFLGDASVDLAHFQIQQKENGEKKRFSMDGLKMTTISQALTDTVNYSMAFRIDQAITDDTSYGPGTCELEIRKLDTASLAELQQVFHFCHGIFQGTIQPRRFQHVEFSQVTVGV